MIIIMIPAYRHWDNNDNIINVNMIGAGQGGGESIDVCGCCNNNNIVAKLIESCVALLLTDRLLVEERQRFHGNLCVCVCVCTT